MIECDCHTRILKKELASGSVLYYPQHAFKVKDAFDFICFMMNGGRCWDNMGPCQWSGGANIQESYGTLENAQKAVDLFIAKRKAVLQKRLNKSVVRTTPIKYP